MKKILLLVCVVSSIISCKKDTIDNPTPVIPPNETEVAQSGLVTTSIMFPGSDSTFTITFDPTKGNAGLAGYGGDVYIHLGAITNSSTGSADWRYVKYDWGTNNPTAKMVKQSNGKYTIQINPRSFLGVPSGETIVKLAMVFRNADGTLTGKNKDNSDIFIPLFNTSGLKLRFVQPEFDPYFNPMPSINITATGQELTVTGAASQKASLNLLLNGTSFATASNAFQVTGKATIGTTGLQTVKIIANGSTETSFSFFVGGTAVIEALPANAKLGTTFINNGSSVIVALYAPGKQFVNVIGDFNNWTPDNNSTMKKTPDGNIWWVQINGLTANTMYAYQYLVDGSLRIADPYTQKVLDPWNDGTIPAVNNNNFGTYPAGKTTGIVSTMSSDPALDYNMTHSLNRPVKNNLVIYELLLRDFLADNNYKTLTDTLNYFTRLGVNAIELMPVNEFGGNSSWGYNPDFYFAPDKYYGSKYYLQRFIDECHGRGIAVIVDMVLNHSTAASPMAQLYWDAANNRPAANSPWYNSVSPHPLDFGPDFNHESAATKLFVKDVVKFWMQEYKVDGFRFDLSKGFTQKNTGTDFNAWNQLDQSRVNIWKDYNNYIKSIDANNFYVILEHLGVAEEEKLLAAEGMMLWNEMTYNFNEATMGWLPNSDFKWAVYKEHGFTSADGLVTFMESHDKERIMYKNITYGNSTNTSYNIKDVNVALKRTEMAAAFLFAIPGPKMIWQFGELGYDRSIFSCTDGSIPSPYEQNESCKLSPKPPLWQYNTVSQRVVLKNAFAKFINLKKKNSIFTTSNLVYDFSGAIKYIKLVEGSKTVVVVGNFDVTNQTANIDFGTSGVWYDAANSNVTMNLSSSTYTTTMQPGAYHIYSNMILSE
ncbi:MAG: alpha-amylase family glycosyl hydrolase [Niabella sp.]